MGYRELRRRYITLIERFGAQVLQALQGRANLIDTAGLDGRYWRALERRLETALLRLMLDPLMQMLARTVGQSEQAIERTVRRAQVLTPMQSESEWLDDPLLQAMASWVAQVWRGVAREVAEQVSTRVSQGLAGGETLDELMDAIAQMMGPQAEYRLERVVRTETTRAYNYGLVYHGLRYDEIGGYRYEVVVDDRTSPVCQPLAGKIVARARIEYLPPLHPNCRTVLVPILREQMPSDTGAYAQPQDFDSTARRFGAIPELLTVMRNPQSALESFSMAWQSSEHTLYEYCMSLTRSDERARDLVQETYLRARTRYYYYDPQYRFTQWVCGIARNLHQNQQSREKRLTAID